MELPIIVTRLIQILKGKLTIIISEDPRKVPRLSYLRYLKKKKEKRGRGQISNTWQAAEI